MPVLESEVIVAAPRSIVFDVARDVEAFSSIMADVESVTILERSDDGSRVLTKWVGLVPEFKQKIRWTEEDIWDSSAFTCKFAQTTGDYQAYGGEWRFEEVDKATTKFISTIHYELEIPLIGPLLKNLIAKKMRDNTDQVLNAIKSQAEANATSSS